MSSNNSSMLSDSNKNDDVKVVMEQTFLKTEEVFVYRIPPMMTSGGHHAEDWNLANPLATCSLHVFRRNDDLLIQLMTDSPKVGGPPGSTEQHLFAQCHIQLELSKTNAKKVTKPMEFWVEKVTDSSRYFVIRISDEQSGREAFIGMGFRERTDATNFKMSLQEYENALRKDQKAKATHLAYEKEHQNKDSAQFEDGDSCEVKYTHDYLSKLTFKEGEKIHVNIKGKDGQPRPAKSNKEKKTPTKTGKIGLPLLRKPPTISSPLKNPPPPSPARSDNTARNNMLPVVIDTNNIIESSTNSLHSSVKSVSSTFAVGNLDDLNDDEWGDFESSH